jgi:hypothetical protein
VSRAAALVGAQFANRYTAKPNYTPTASLTTPTYDGSGVTTEPTWIKKPSWVTAVGTDLLAHNPLTGGSSDVENPSLLISNDNGSTWTTPPGLTNPIAPKPTPTGQAGDNADSHVLADPTQQRLIMSWNVSSRTDNTNLNGNWYSICTDPTLATWGAPTQLMSVQSGPSEQEPKIVWDQIKRRFLLFTQDSTATPNVLKVRIGGSNPLTGYSAPTICTLVIPGGQALWHPDIIQEASGRFVMAFCDSNNPGSLSRQGWLASSWDGIHWRCAPRPFMTANNWATAGVYRPSIQPARTGNGYDLIVARHQTPDARLGLVRNVPASEVP